MRRFAIVFGAALPLLGASGALAEDVLIRVEAKRGTEVARSAAQGWSERFDDVVTFPLSDGWIGIGLGPMPREQATARLRQLRSDGQVPGDSFIAPADGRRLTQVDSPTTPDASAAAPEPVAAVPPEAPAADTGPVAAGTPGTPSTFPQPAAPEVVTPVEPPAPAKVFLRLESTTDRAKAEEMLAKWRETLPEAGLWTLPNGRLAIAFGPVEEPTGEAWLTAFKAAGAIPKDAFLTSPEEVGEVAIAGSAPELAPPPATDAARPAMPSLEDIQRALRWAGHYDGAIDGKDGPMTRAAIAAEIVRLRASPDTATAMAELTRRREAWRTEMGLTELQDSHTGLALPAPMDRLQFDRAERALSIYGPKDGSGAALILFSQPGGQQELQDLSGLVTALGWVPAPTRRIQKGSIILDGRNQTHIGHAEGRVVDGHAQGFVLIWPVQNPEEQRRLAAELSDNIARFAPGAGEAVPEIPAIAPATEVTTQTGVASPATP
ncbi:peptidoglycan-binding domain-containing protein [Paracoccus broussonetiae]|uniref:Peptidoglycan-binding domain-containing protein n=1 Tax=Paracoccus broussonetiae subsp. drimophilus TaxID=3373869 RepID=A0ABW7LQZ8_9RHOB